MRGSQVQSIADDVTSKATESYELVKSVVDQVVTASKPIVDVVTPVVQQAAQKAIEVATPVAADVASKAQQALSDAGVDTSPAFEAAKVIFSLHMFRSQSDQLLVTLNCQSLLVICIYVLVIQYHFSYFFRPQCLWVAVYPPALLPPWKLLLLMHSQPLRSCSHKTLQSLHWEQVLWFCYTYWPQLWLHPWHIPLVDTPEI